MPSTQPPSSQQSTTTQQNVEQGSKQKPLDVATAVVSDSKSNAFSKDGTPLPARDTKKILAGARSDIADIKTKKNFEDFCHKVKETLQKDYDSIDSKKPCVKELTTKQIKKKRLLIAGSVFWATIMVAEITILVLTLTAVMPYLVPILIAVPIFIALSAGITINHIYEITAIKPVIKEQVEKDMKITDATLDVTTFDALIYSFFDNKKIDKLLQKYNEKQFQELATNMITLLEDKNMYMQTNQLFTNFFEKINTDLASANEQDDLDYQKYKKTLVDIHLKIIECLFQSIEKHIQDKKIKSEISQNIIKGFEKKSDSAEMRFYTTKYFYKYYNVTKVKNMNDISNEAFIKAFNEYQQTLTSSEKTKTHTEQGLINNLSERDENIKTLEKDSENLENHASSFAQATKQLVDEQAKESKTGFFSNFFSPKKNKPTNTDKNSQSNSTEDQTPQSQQNNQAATQPEKNKPKKTGFLSRVKNKIKNK